MAHMDVNGTEHLVIWCMMMYYSLFMTKKNRNKNGNKKKTLD